ncbi:YTH domain-containing protein 1-like isoform X1 [Passer domesticus]|uniref:YTH domain-containing protein 1-like isoform X1 n=1 Tax=Passer domesticus TaxID=48849 RepID=UPI0030FF399F
MFPCFHDRGVTMAHWFHSVTTGSAFCQAPKCHSGLHGPTRPHSVTVVSTGRTLQSSDVSGADELQPPEAKARQTCLSCRLVGEQPMDIQNFECEIPVSALCSWRTRPVLFHRSESTEPLCLEGRRTRRRRKRRRMRRRRRRRTRRRSGTRTRNTRRRMRKKRRTSRRTRRRKVDEEDEEGDEDKDQEEDKEDEEEETDEEEEEQYEEEEEEDEDENEAEEEDEEEDKVEDEDDDEEGEGHNNE